MNVCENHVRNKLSASCDSCSRLELRCSWMWSLFPRSTPAYIHTFSSGSMQHSFLFMIYIRSQFEYHLPLKCGCSNFDRKNGICSQGRGFEQMNDTIDDKQFVNDHSGNLHTDHLEMTRKRLLNVLDSLGQCICSDRLRQRGRLC